MAIAQLGYKVDSKDLVVAAGRLDDMTRAAGGAEKSSGELASKIAPLAASMKAAGLSVSQVSSSLSKMASTANIASVAVGGMGKAIADDIRNLSAMSTHLDDVRMSVDPLYAASKRYEGELNRLNYALEVGAVNQKRYNAILDQMNSGYNMATSGLAGYSRSANVASMHTTNLMFQFQDIGMMLAAGQNPLMLAMQQGTQVAGVFHQMKGAGMGAFAGIKAGLLAMLSPISLVTIGVIAGGAALVQWGYKALGAGNEAATFSDRLANLGEMLKPLSGYVIAAGVAMTAYYLPSMISAAPAIAAAVTANLSFIASLVTLRGVLISTGIGAFIVGAGYLINKFIDLVKGAGGFGNALSILKDVALETWDRIRAAAMAANYDMMSSWGQFQVSVLRVLSGIADTVLGSWANKIIGAIVGAKDVVVMAWEALPTAFARIGALAVNGLSEMIQKGIKGVLAPLNAILEYAGLEQINPQWGDILNVPAAEATAADLAGAFSSALNTDYTGGIRSGIADTAKELEATAQWFGLMGNEAWKLAGKPLTSLDKLSNAVSDVGDSSDDTTEILEDMENAAGGAGKAASRAANQFRDQARALNEAANPMAAYAAGLAEIEAMKPYLTVGGLSKAMDDLNKKIADQIPMVNDVSDAFADFAMRGFRDFKSFANSIVASFKSMIAEMIATAARNTIMIALGFSGSGGGGLVSGLAGKLLGSTGGGGLLGGIGSKLLGSFGGTGGLLSRGLAGLGGGTGLLGGLGNVVSGVFGGGGIGSIFKIGSAASAAGGGLMASIGAAIPVVGLLAGAIGLFSKKVSVSTREIDRGLTGTIKGFDASVRSFKKIEKTVTTSRFFGLSKSSSTSNYTVYKSTDVLDQSIADIQSSVADAARVMGFGASAFDKFSYDFRLSLKGLSDDDARKKIEQELQKMGDTMASVVPKFSDMGSLINAANVAVQETYGMGATRFEAEMLAAARRRGEITMDRMGPGAETNNTLLRLQSVEKNTADNASLMKRLVEYIEGWTINGVPVEA